MGKNYCTECGEKINESDKFCQNCGTTINKNDPKEKKVTTNTKSSNKGKKLQKKHAIILGVAVILGLILLISVSGILDNSPSHVKNVKVYKQGKVYKIDYDCDISTKHVLINLIKEGDTLYTTKGDLGTWTSGKSVTIELVKDVEIDEIRFTLYNQNLEVTDSGTIKDFEIIEQ